MTEFERLEAQIAALQVAISLLIPAHPHRAQLAQQLRAGGDLMMSNLLASERSEEFVRAVQERIDALVVLAAGGS
ncbi:MULTISPECIES: hypothetical protein [Burkholderia cepacia complex]|uniref:hypothetical protein n=1 Tax=Burkholderia cepacia complex TaxID=87882 RepID=UPI0011B25236|nr:MULTISPECIES: hypothetical protein [Burkholderia cepacia complex]MBH9645069.1 hypothetical protein [Burkholderia vietnamiensis]MBU9147352.1 hypothetical protein [Burkholderia multivorans]MCA8247976.1 hypothetical protein [Burkholderia multivorans]MCO8625986.1 hypothetical protein [Burkholderia multivorans]HDR8953380.1 hypothetical protein [Burkholderia vietnamiensis]